MLFTLPSDITLYILSFISFHAISKLYTLSRSTYCFLHKHKDALYHQLAELERPLLVYAHAEYHCERADTPCDAGQKFVILEQNWSGRGYIVQGGYTCFDTAVDQFAIDNDHSVLLALTARSELVVRTVDGSQLIWTLPKVTQFVHSGDLLLLWRGMPTTGSIEVWRFVDKVPTTVTPITHPSSLAATESQLQEYADHSKMISNACSWQMFPKTFHNSHLDVVARDQPHVIQIYDVLRGELDQVIDLDLILLGQSTVLADQHVLLSSALLDMQLSVKYLCAWFDFAFVLIRLRNEADVDDKSHSTTPRFDRNVVFYKDYPPSRKALCRFEKVAGQESGVSAVHGVKIPKYDHMSMAVTAGVEALNVYTVVALTPEEVQDLGDTFPHFQGRHRPCYSSAKFSPDGCHLVIGTMSGMLYLFPDIDRMFDAGVAPQDIVQRLVVQQPVWLIQWEAQNRIFSFRDVRHRLFSLSLQDTDMTWLVDLFLSSKIEDHLLPLGLVGARALHVHTLSRHHGLTHGTVQIRKAGIWALADRVQMHQRICIAKAEETGDIDEVRGLDGKRMGETEGFENSTTTVCFLSFTTEWISQ
ncbi:hypothetical protein BC835DRAFT_1368073 [Cytidiella melzeri]|nr:hypothetical protein BC835DRAFT_1368073 [Cytidiella melzeri]